MDIEAAGKCKTCRWAHKCIECDRGIPCKDYVLTEGRVKRDKNERDYHQGRQAGKTGL